MTETTTKRGTAAAAGEREDRIMRIAETMFSQEGEQRLQMKELARRAEVSLATLYQLFPSKDHLLAAIALGRQRRMAARIDGTEVEGKTPGERAGAVMLEEFRYVQRNPEIASGFQRVTNAPNRSTSEYVAGIRAAMEQTLLVALAVDGVDATPEQSAVMPIFLSASYGAITGWLSGMLSVEQARAQIRMAQRLFDLPADVVHQHLLD